MKYLIILASGMADEPLAELGGRTPLAAAHKPALDELARKLLASDSGLKLLRTTSASLKAIEDSE